MKPFGEALAAEVRAKRSPVVVGLDPRLAQLPQALRDVASGDFMAQARAYREFCRAVIDVIAPLAAAVKPQAAFFEELGPDGMSALADVIHHARRSGLVVILDGKRNDIGPTATAYARGYLGRDGKSAWGADALTVSPYLGADSLEPFVEIARERSAGVFVLVKTSNPGGGLFQDLFADGRTVYRHVAAQVEEFARVDAGRDYGSVGAVVGATYPDQLAELRAAMPHAWILIPGFGSQGGTAHDAAAGFDSAGLGAIVNNSRGIIFAYEREQYRHFGERDWQRAVEAATRDMLDELRTETPAGRL